MSQGTPITQPTTAKTLRRPILISPNCDDEYEQENPEEKKRIESSKRAKHELPCDSTHLHDSLIPHAKDIKLKRQQEWNQERSDFIKEVIHIFQRNIAQGKSVFTVCYDVKYEWQQSCLETLFASKGYNLVYKNIREYHDDYSSAELSIPGVIDHHKPFQI